MVSKKRPITIWDDPPDFKAYLCCSIVLTLSLSSVILFLGMTLMLAPDSLFSSYLRQQRESPETCKIGDLDLCPTAANLSLETARQVSWYNYTARFVCGTGLFSVLLSLTAGLVTLWRNNKTLFVTLLLMPVALTLEWKLVDLTVFVNTPFHEWGKDEFVDIYKANYRLNETSVNAFTRTMNSFMLASHCCGIRGAKDAVFETPVLIYAKDTHSFEIPPACCVRRRDDVISPSLLKTTMTKGGMCVSKDESWVANQEGCFGTTFSYLYENYTKYFIFLLLPLIALQSIQTIFTIFVMLKPIKVKVNDWPRSKAISEVDTLKKLRSSARSQIIRKPDVRSSTYIE